MQLRRKPGRPPTLTPERIVTAAIELAEETGALRLADLGERLGADTSAMYRHFRGRGALMSAMADEFTRPLREPLPATGSWRDDAIAHLRRIEQHYRAHPVLATMVMTEAELSGEALEVIAEGARVLRRSGAPDRAVFVALHSLEITMFGSIMYDTVGGPAADDVRREYHRLVGEFDVNALYPTPAELAAESSSTMWALMHAALDELERQAPR